MASTTLILNGFNFLNDADVSKDPKGGYQNEGQITVEGGYTPFEADDIVVITVDGVTADLEVVDTSKITGIIVYDSAADYFNSVSKYEYTTKNSGININSDPTSLGDTYMRFNARGAKSTDPNAPDLSKVLVAAGTDLSGIANGDKVTIDVFSDVDYNQDSTIDSSTVELANGAFATENNIFSLICYTHGTLIDAPGGPRYVDTLKPGDMVNTLDNGPQRVRWIKGRKVAGNGRHAPILIRAGALGNIRDLRVSPNHRMLVRGPSVELHFGHHQVLIAAKHLVNGDTIRPDPCHQVSYFHFLLDQHEIVFAEACPSESLFLGEQSLASVTDESREEIFELFPECRAMGVPSKLARYALNRHESDVWKLCA